MANVGFKQEAVFYHELDGVRIKIIKISDEEFLWIQLNATPNNTIWKVDFVKTYNQNAIESMIEFFKPYGSMEALQMFEKFIQL